MRREFEPETSKQGHYAGPATRLAAYVVDLALSVGLFALTVAVVLFLLELVTSFDLETDQLAPWIGAIIFAGWLFLYFGGSWAASGKTAGMALLGVRVVDRDGSDLEPWRGFLRAPRSRSASPRPVSVASASFSAGRTAGCRTSSPAASSCTTGTPGQHVCASSLVAARRSYSDRMTRDHS